MHGCDTGHDDVIVDGSGVRCRTISVAAVRLQLALLKQSNDKETMV